VALVIASTTGKLSLPEIQPVRIYLYSILKLTAGMFASAHARFFRKVNFRRRAKMGIGRRNQSVLAGAATFTAEF
jgi:hypothetical protein